MAALSRFISRLGEKGLPFFKLLKASEKFSWTEEADAAFTQLKTFLTSPPVLTAPQPNEDLPGHVNSGRARRARSRLQGPKTRLFHKRSLKRVQGQIPTNTEAHIRHSNNVEEAKALLRRPSSLGNHQFPSLGYSAQ